MCADQYFTALGIVPTGCVSKAPTNNSGRVARPARPKHGMEFPLIKNCIIWLQREQFGLLPESHNQGWPATHALESADRFEAQVAKILRAKISNLVLLQVAPDVLRRIQFRGISGQKLQTDPSVLLSYEVSYGAAAMRRPAVPNDQQLAGNVA